MSRLLPALFDPAVERAILASYQAHDGQTRKGSGGAPYVTHPFHIALVLARFGADATLLVAALLHDAVEDCDDWTLARVEHEFGLAVRSIVDELTEDKNLTWEQRKAAWVEAVPTMSPEAVIVKSGDKLHNLHSLAADLESATDKATIWAKFHGGREQTIAHSRALVSALAKRAPEALANELLAAFERFERAAA